MPKIDLGDNVEGAIIITYGDTDDDGKQGIRALVYADVPFDGSEEPKPVFDSGEMERVPQVDVPEKVADVLKFLSPVAKLLVGLKRKIFPGN